MLAELMLQLVPPNEMVMVTSVVHAVCFVPLNIENFLPQSIIQYEPLLWVATKGNCALLSLLARLLPGLSRIDFASFAWPHQKKVT